MRLFSSQGEPGERIIVKVPPMGDSINEGGIVEWLKTTGDVVTVDDVTVVIETDKVNVDVRSEVNGRILETYGEEGDSVEVGDDLLALELLSAEDAQAAAQTVAPPKSAAPPKPSPPPPKESPKTAAAAPVPSAPAVHNAPHRVPSIKFRHGDRAAIDRELEAALGSAAGDSVSASSIGVDIVEKPSPRFARKPLTEYEIDLIISGGAEEWN